MERVCIHPRITGNSGTTVRRDIIAGYGLPTVASAAMQSSAQIIVTPAEIDRTFRLLLYDALASEAMSTLTTGVFLTGFALALGASYFAIGVLAAVPSAVQFLQFPAVVLVERLRTRRTICAWASGTGRAFLVTAAIAPFLGGSAGVTLLVVSIAIYQGSAAVAGCAWNSWMRDLVPESEFGRFFGRRAAANTAMAIALALAGGVLIDRLKLVSIGPSGVAFTGLFLLGAAIGSAIEFRPRSAGQFWPISGPSTYGARDGSGGLLWTGKPKWICSSCSAGSMSSVLER